MERYELDVFADDEEFTAAKAAGVDGSESTVALQRATSRAGRRKAAAQASLFDLVNQRVVDELRDIDAATISPEQAKELLRRLREQIL